MRDSVMLQSKLGCASRPYDNERREPTIHLSLQQTYTIGDKSIDIQIYRLPETGWTIEVVHEHGNSTVWNDEFATDQDAFDEVMRTIAEDGIDALIGKPSAQPSSLADDGIPTPEEIAILDDFLSGDSIADTSMDFATLEGFLTAIAIGPRMVRPSEWIPWIWDMDDAENAPEFSGEQEANRIMSLVFRTLQHDRRHLQHRGGIIRADLLGRASMGCGRVVRGIDPDSSLPRRNGRCSRWGSRHGSRLSCAWVRSRVSRSPMIRAMPKSG